MSAIPLSANAETLREALTAAYQNNPAIASALLSVKATAENIVLAKSATRPQISASGSVTESTTSSGGSPFTVSDPSVSFGLNYSQTIFDNGKTDANIEQARALTELSRYTLQNAEQNVLLSVVQAYMGVLQNTQLVQLRQASVKFYQLQVDSSNQRLKIGEGTKIDVSQADARLAQATASYQSAVSSLQTSQASYERWVGHKPRNLSDTVNFGSLLPKSVDQAVAEATSSNPAILSARASLRASQAGVDVAESAFGPSLALTASIGTTVAGGVATNVGSARLAFSVPLYAGGALGASMRKANLTEVKSEVDAMATRDQVKESTITAWATMQNAAALIASASSAVDSGQLVLEGITQQRDVGQSTTLDVLNSQAELTSVQEGLIQARSSRIIASFAVIAATGHLTAADLSLPVTIDNGEGYISAVEDVWAELKTITE